MRLRPLRGLAALAAVVAVLDGAAAGRPLQLEDLLQREGFGRALITPDGRRLLLERHAPYASAPRFDYERFNDLARSRLLVAELGGRGARLRPLLEPRLGCGDTLGPVSPDSAFAAVYRLCDLDWRVGLVELNTGRVRWLALTPEAPVYGRTVAWRSSRQLLVIARPLGDLPYELRWRRTAPARLPDLWARTGRGGVARTVVGSGRYIAERPRPPERRLVEVSAGSGRMRLLRRGDLVDLEPSPSGRRLALISAGPDIPLAASRPLQGPWGVGLWSRRLEVLDLESGGPRRACDSCDVAAAPLAWSAGDSLLFLAREDGAPWTSARFYRLDASQAAPQPIPGVSPVVQLRPEHGAAGWWGDEPLVYGRPETGAGGRADWIRVSGGRLLNLTAALPEPVPPPVALRGGGLTVYAGDRTWRVDGEGRAWAQDEARQPMLERGVLLERDRLVSVPASVGPAVRLGIDGAAPAWLGGRLVVPPMGAVLAHAPDGRGALVRTLRGGGAESLWWCSPDAPPVQLAEANAHLAAVEPPELKSIYDGGRPGGAILGWLVAPQGVQAPAPLVVWPYLGAALTTRPAWVDPRDAGFNMTPALLAARGYAVLLPSLPSVAGEPTAGLADRVLRAVDAAARQPDLAPLFDADRLAIWGHSYGGYTALATLTQTGRFRAAIVESAPTDLLRLWGEFQAGARVAPESGLSVALNAGWTEALQGAMGGPPWSHPERYLRGSPGLQADRIRTPLLLMHGDQDSFPVSQAEGVFSGLYRQGKDAMLVTYWGEGHVIRSPGNLRDKYARAFDWLSRHLGPRLRAGLRRPPAPGPASSGPRLPPLRR